MWVRWVINTPSFHRKAYVEISRFELIKPSTLVFREKWTAMKTLFSLGQIITKLFILLFKDTLNQRWLIIVILFRYVCVNNVPKFYDMIYLVFFCLSFIFKSTNSSFYICSLLTKYLLLLTTTNQGILNYTLFVLVVLQCSAECGGKNCSLSQGKHPIW